MQHMLRVATAAMTKRLVPRRVSPRNILHETKTGIDMIRYQATSDLKTAFA
jgi:hypothetical protein